MSRSQAELIVREWHWFDSEPHVSDEVQGHPDQHFRTPVQNAVGEHNKLARAYLDLSRRVEEFAEYCDRVEQAGSEDNHGWRLAASMIAEHIRAALSEASQNE